MARTAIQATECRGRRVIREMGEPPATPELTPAVRVAARAAPPAVALAPPAEAAPPAAVLAPREAQVAATRERAGAARVGMETPVAQGRAPALVRGAVSLLRCSVGRRRPV